MPLMTLHAAVELFPGEDEDARDADIARLRAVYPSHEAARGLPDREPYTCMRVATEIYGSTLECLVIKIMNGVFPDSPVGAQAWIDTLQDELPSLAPEIIGALAHGISHISFDTNAEGWTFCPDGPPGGHARLARNQAAIATLMGRTAEGIESYITETWDPQGLPKLLAETPLPDTGS